MRRWVWLTLVLALPCLIQCGSGSDSGAASGPCASGRAYAISVPGPQCSVYLSCGKNLVWKLDCSGSASGNCTCLENDVSQKDVPFQSTFCPPDFNQKDMSSYYAAAREACGWPE